MEAIFTLPYSEYETILEFQKYFKKKHYSFLIPTSRQQKGFDFVIINPRSKKTIRIQVKGSRSWQSSKYLENPKEYKRHVLFFHNFKKNYKPNQSDIYVLFGLYPSYVNELNIRSKSNLWKNIVLVFKDKEMWQILKSIKTKGKLARKKMDNFFYINFNDDTDICGTRGFVNKPKLSRYLVKNRIKLITNLLK